MDQNIVNKQELWVLKGGFIIKYFNLGKGDHQDDPISAYLFILALEILFLYIKNESSIKGNKVFDYVLLWWHMPIPWFTVFPQRFSFIKKLLDILSDYSKYSDLKPNFSKCEIAGMGSLKGVKVAVCGTKCVNLKEITIKILGTRFSQNSKLYMEKNS